MFSSSSKSQTIIEVFLPHHDLLVLYPVPKENTPDLRKEIDIARGPRPTGVFSFAVGKSKMNNHKSDQDNNKNEEPQISIEFDDGIIIQFPPSTFNYLIEREVTNYILENQTIETPIIDLNELVNVQCWKKKYEDLEIQDRMLGCIANRLMRDLKINKFAQPMRCMPGSVSQNVNVTMPTTSKINALKSSKKEYQIFTISDSEDDDVIITDMSNIKSIQTKNDNIIDLDTYTQNLEVKYKPVTKSKKNCISYSEDNPVIITDVSKIKPIQTKNNNIIDLIDLDNNSQNLDVKCKPALKSKTNVSIPDLKTNDNNKVLPINTEAVKTLSNGKCSSITITKRRPGLKSKTMFVSDMVPFNAENEETVEKKMRLNECEVINNKESNTTNLLNCNSVKKLEVPENNNHNFFNKSSNLKYPPPYPLIPPYNNQPSWKNVPPIPNMTIKTSGNKVTLTWNLHLTWQMAEIKMYELFVCQETDAPPNISMWKKKGNIDADLLPMACELEVFDLGHIYHFALRAVDVHNRRAPFAVLKTKI